jgi:hypothetical protein
MDPLDDVRKRTVDVSSCSATHGSPGDRLREGSSGAPPGRRWLVLVLGLVVVVAVGLVVWLIVR